PCDFDYLDFDKTHAFLRASAFFTGDYLVKNAETGREDQSRACIACNWCMASLIEGSQTCTINPAAWRERFWGRDHDALAPRRCKVVVVGAGPGGLEAARTSALRGHQVILIEAERYLGGAFALWADLPGRETYQKATAWWKQEIEKLGVEVRLGTLATAEMILAEKPDAVILATGAEYNRAGQSHFRDQPIEGHQEQIVYTPMDVLNGSVGPLGKAVLLDGEGMHTGVGIAELLARNGTDVEMLTPYFTPVSARVVAQFETGFIMKRLRDAGVKVSATSYIRHIGTREVTVYDVYSDAERTIADVDAVILSTGRVSRNGLEKELEGKVKQLFPIGDAAAARMWAAASFEGHKFARYIGEPGAPSTIGEVYFADNDPVFAPVKAAR
ncbi:hypothetical protein B2G71_23615, partial [Novosphingobium sp. PC22D]|uniref:NAD(P)/FAD-dependent oxidoreductase n=1 Tax=Novosphingobium sp. PC22D TaxID=1962403 RepID=UPI000BFB064C